MLVVSRDYKHLSELVWGGALVGAQQSAAEVWIPRPITQTDRLDPTVSPMAGVAAPGGLYGRVEAK